MKYDFDRVIDRRGTLCTKWDNLQQRMGNANALPLWVADTDFACSEPIQKAVADRAAHPIFGYSFVPPEFFQAAANWAQRRHGWQISEEDILYFPGVVPFLGVCIRALTAPGDEILIMSPVYHPFAGSIRENGRTVCPCPITYDGSGYSVDFELLDSLLAREQVKLMILCSPHNPTGKVYTDRELLTIGNLCLAHNVVLISDEIHSDVVYKPHKHIPIASLSPDIAANTVTCFSPSKAFNIAGLKASAIVVENPALRKVLEEEVARVHVSSPNAFAMAAFIAAYTQSEDYLDQMVDYLSASVRELDGWLKANTPKIRLVWPEGTYLMWLDCRELGIIGDELHSFFVSDAGVAVNKGEIFGPEGAAFVRLNIACPRATLRQALKQIGEAYSRRF